MLENMQDTYDSVIQYTNEWQQGMVTEGILPKYLEDIVASMEDPDSELMDLVTTVTDLSNAISNHTKTIDKLKELREVIADEDKFLSNSMYDFLEKNELNLYENLGTAKNTVMSVLKAEELSLMSASEITNYIFEGIRDSHMQQAINAIQMAKSAVHAMSTTTVGMNDPIGFILARQNFAKKHKLTSDVSKLKTIDSAEAEMMLNDIKMKENKLKFLKELAKANSGKIFNEQEIIRSVGTKAFIEE